MLESIAAYSTESDYPAIIYVNDDDDDSLQEKLMKLGRVVEQLRQDLLNFGVLGDQYMFWHLLIME